MERHHKTYTRVEASNSRYFSSGTALLSNKEHRVSTQAERKKDLSKEKQNEKVYNCDKRVKIPAPDEASRKHTYQYPTFKGMSKVTEYTHSVMIQPLEEPKIKDRNDKSAKRQNKEIQRVSSAVIINNPVETYQLKRPEVKAEPKLEEAKKNSEKRSAINQKLRKQRDKECSPNEFACDQELETLQPKSSRNTTQKASKPIFTKPNILLPLKQGPEYEIQEFERIQGLINSEQQTNQVMFLNSRETLYSPDAQYIERKQKHFSWFMRAILVEWMMHVSFEYRLKRETFHLATSLTDLYFSRVPNVPKTELQLVGAAAMYLAAKIEEREPLSVIKFAASTSGKYEPRMILSMEAKIVKAMKWELNPPTLSMWANKIMQQWDLFLEQSDYGRSHPLLQQGSSFWFKKFDESSYVYFRQVMQILDCCILDIQSFQYKPKPLVCSIIYLVLKRAAEQVPIKEIIGEFPRRSDYLLQTQNPLNDIFRAFVEHTFGFLLLDLLPTVQYCATFFSLPLTYEAQTISGEQLAQCNLEDYSSFQTYNCNSLSVIKRRNRGIQDIYGQ